MRNTILITVPQMWGEPETSLVIEGLRFNEWAKQQKGMLDTALYQKGFHVACMVSYSYKGVEMIHYALEK